MKIIYLLIVCSFIYSECDDYSQTQCSDDNNCEWIEDIESGSCENLSQNQCDSISQCSWEYGCIQWGWWYNWCYTYGYECMGGTYQFDNGYCQEVFIEYQMGDINEDYLVNILDVIIVVNLILDEESNPIVDMNHDHSIDILDIIQLINIILTP